MNDFTFLLFFMNIFCTLGFQPVPRILPVKENKLVAFKKYLSAFENIVVDGVMHVEIDSKCVASRNYNVEFLLPDEKKGKIFASVEHGTLYLHDKDKNQLSTIVPRVKISMGVIRNLTCHGAETLIGKNIFARKFSACIKGGRHIELSGKKMDLRLLDATQSGTITLRGVQSPSLLTLVNDVKRLEINGVMNLEVLQARGQGDIIIRTLRNFDDLNVVGGDNAHMTLSGVVKDMEVALSQNSRLNAVFLDVNNSIVNTRDSARADVKVHNLLSAFSSGNSRIYYYRYPNVLTKYFYPMSSILLIKRGPK